jgi:hypothetical protein
MTPGKGNPKRHLFWGDVWGSDLARISWGQHGERGILQIFYSNSGAQKHNPKWSLMLCGAPWRLDVERHKREITDRATLPQRDLGVAPNANVFCATYS